MTVLFLVALLAASAVLRLAGRLGAAVGVYLIYTVAAGVLYVYLGLGLVVSMAYAMLAGHPGSDEYTAIYDIGKKSGDECCGFCRKQ